MRVGLPYKVVGGTRFYERREVRDALAYLRALANPDDVVSLRRILNVPKRGIGERAEACVAALAERERIGFPAALERADEAPGLAARSLTCIRGFTDLHGRAAHRRRGRRRPVDGAGGGAGPLRPARRAAREPRPAGRVPGGEPRRAVGGGRRSTRQANPEGTLADFLETVSLVADADQIPGGAVADGADEQAGGGLRASSRS